MDRRNFFTTAAAMAPASLAIAQPGDKKPAILELRYFRSRNTADNQRGKLGTFLGTALAPALKRAGAATVGVFSASIAPDSPYYLMVAQHASLGAFETAWDAILQDEALAGGRSYI